MLFSKDNLIDGIVVIELDESESTRLLSLFLHHDHAILQAQRREREKRKEGKRREGKRIEGKARERKGREGEGRKGKGKEREGKV